MIKTLPKLVHLIAGQLFAVILLIAATPTYAETYFFHNDHLGTPQAVTDDNQQVVWQAEYHPFGEVVETVNAVEQNLRFPGQYFDVETGLHYNSFRDYDPSIGRYVESDPIGLGGGVNTFGYVDANPLVYFDKFGLHRFGPGRHPTARPNPYWHNDRNKFNRCPKREPRRNQCGPEFDQWSKEPDVTANKFHGGFSTYRGTGKNHGSQCVYNSNGTLIDSGPFMGTYDYQSPLFKNGIPNPISLIITHPIQDVVPYFHNPNYTPNLTTQY